MEQLFHVVIDYIASWGYAAIVIGMALESACLPVPSELIFGFAGYLVYLGQLDFTMSIVAGVIGGQLLPIKVLDLMVFLYKFYMDGLILMPS